MAMSSSEQVPDTKGLEYGNPPVCNTLTCLLTNNGREARALLEGSTLADFTPVGERTLYSNSTTSCFVPERLSLPDLNVGQRLKGRVTCVERAGLRLDLGLPSLTFIHKTDLNGVRATCHAILEVEVIRVDLKEGWPVLKAISNLSLADDSSGDLPNISKKMACSMCGVSFGNRDEQVSHYKLDWHRYNLKQRILGQNPVSETAFGEMAEAISSLSGSESEDDPNGEESSGTGSETSSPKRKINLPLSRPALRSRHRSASVTSTDDTEGEAESAASKARLHSKVFVRNSKDEIVSFFRCLLHNKYNAPESSTVLMSLVHSLPSRVNWAIILVGGGHFAAAIFNGSEIKCHKTFHRYTVRAKQGGAQASRDARGGGAKSAGATLRRYNEAALIKDVQDCLGGWSSELSECQAVFFRAPSFNRVSLFGGKSPPFNKDDPRLRVIPFATRRATYKEVQRVHSVLATIECHGPQSQFNTALLNTSPVKKSKNKASNSQQNKERSSEAKELVPEQELKLNFETENNEDADSEPELIMTEETMSTFELQETYVSVTGHPFRKKRRKPKGSKRQQDPGTPAGQESERYQLKNALYSACSSGQVLKVQELLERLSILGNNSTSVSTQESILPTANSNNQPVTDRSKANESIEFLNATDSAKGFPNATDSMKGFLNTNDSSGDFPNASDSIKGFLNSTTSTNATDTSKGFQNATVLTDVPPVASGEPSRGFQNATVLTNGSPIVSGDSSNGFQNATVLTDGSPIASGDSSTSSGHTAKPILKDLLKSAVNVKAHPSPTDSEVDFSGGILRFNTSQPLNVKSKEDSTERKEEELKELLNEPVGNFGGTLLHVAAKEGHKDVVRILMELGADPAIKNKQGHTPYVLAGDKDTRNEFRRFWGCHPERYDYARSQIPGPLTSELERCQQERAAERRREKKKVQKVKAMDRRMEEETIRKEDDDKKRFLELSDREKRALAAERRFITSGNTSTLKLSRCFLCGLDITGKVPFEYSDNRFCSTKCVQVHRKRTVKS